MIILWRYNYREIFKFQCWYIRNFSLINDILIKPQNTCTCIICRIFIKIWGLICWSDRQTIGKVPLQRCVFGSPEPNAQVSFSGQNLSVVRRRRCCCRKLFTFSPSSPEPLDQFQPNLAQSIFGWSGFKFFQKKGLVLFQEKVITK